MNAPSSWWKGWSDSLSFKNIIKMIGVKRVFTENYTLGRNGEALLTTLFTVGALVVAGNVQQIRNFCVCGHDRKTHFLVM